MVVVIQFTSANHGFETGDMVRATELTSASTPTGSGINPAQLYFVTKLSDTTFRLSTGSLSGTSVDLTEASGDDPATALVFTKEQKTLNFQTMDREATEETAVKVLIKIWVQMNGPIRQVHYECPVKSFTSLQMFLQSRVELLQVLIRFCFGMRHLLQRS